MIRRERRTAGTRIVAVLLAAILAAALAGCSGGGGDSDASSGEVAPASDGRLLTGSEGRAPADGTMDALSDSDGSKRAPVQTRAVISTGQVRLESDDLVEVRSQIDRLLGRFGGYVAREETHHDEEDRTSQSTLQLRVPSRHFDAVMASFEEFAVVIDTNREAEDVTTEVIDVASRIRTQEISLERLRSFLRQATKVSDMIRLESEIARREADLASLRGQQDYLDDQTSLATITVKMALPDEAAAAVEEDPLEDAGFLTGLKNGWAALTDVVVVGATVLGALLPFAAVLALVVVPLVIGMRAARRRRLPTSAPPPAG